MDNIKFLQVNSLYFRLPDNFNGTTQEAFKLLAKHFADCTLDEPEESEKDLNTLDKECWDSFKDYYPHDEFKVVGSFGITELKDGKYIILD